MSYGKEELTDDDLMPWGIHRNKKLANVPAWYLIKQYEQGKLKGGLLQYIESNMDALKKEARQ